MATSQPNIEELKKNIVEDVPQVKVEEQDLIRRIKSASALLHLNESQFLSTSRKRWSLFLCVCIGISLLFQIILTVLVGSKVLDFQAYKGFLPVVAGASFAQIVGLAAIALKWIFGGKHPDELLQETKVSD